MPLVSIEQDARYRRDRDRFVEVCRSCDRVREGDAERCACGATFTHAKRGFLVTSWVPTTVRPDMPPVCPHCEGPTTVMRSVTMMLPTSRGESTRMTIEIPSCKKMLPPFAAYLLLITSAFFVVVFGLATLFGKGPVAAGLLALAIAGGIAAWRAYGWVRFAGFDHRSVRLRARRRGYAIALADRNHGRIV